MTWSLAIILIAVICMVIGALQILLWVWRGLKTFLRKPTAAEMSNFWWTN